MLKLRKSTPADGERIVEIWRDAVDATHHFLAPEDRRAIEAEVRGSLPGADLWLAVTSEDRPVGFMGLSGRHMDALFIDLAHRGQGVGRALVEHALAMSQVLTTDVNEQNPQAVGFYERMGFKPFGRSERDGEGRPYPLIHLRRDLAG